MKNCKAFVKDSGKCSIKVHTRYNDYCDGRDCPKKGNQNEKYQPNPPTSPKGS